MGVRRHLLAVALCSAHLLGCAAKSPQVNPQLPTLHADLWVQTAAEYEALCLQIYRDAGDRVVDTLQRARFSKPPAVVLDLDETVIDNAGYQTFLYRQGATYSTESWEAWVRRQSEGAPRAVPGALEFLNRIREAGAAPVFLSNRLESSREYTLATLLKLGIDPKPSELLLRTDVSSKTARRRTVESAFAVVALIGDNLADFAEEFESTGDDHRRRLEAARRVEDKWGAQWFVLPNPTYGDWLRAVPEPAEGGLRDR